jgi:hypothetical protein
MDAGGSELFESYEQDYEAIKVSITERLNASGSQAGGMLPILSSGLILLRTSQQYLFQDYLLAILSPVPTPWPVSLPWGEGCPLSYAKAFLRYKFWSNSAQNQTWLTRFLIAFFSLCRF